MNILPDLPGTHVWSSAEHSGNMLFKCRVKHLKFLIEVPRITDI